MADVAVGMHVMAKTNPHYDPEGGMVPGDEPVICKPKSQLSVLRFEEKCACHLMEQECRSFQGK